MYELVEVTHIGKAFLLQRGINGIEERLALVELAETNLDDCCFRSRKHLGGARDHLVFISLDVKLEQDFGFQCKLSFHLVQFSYFHALYRFPSRLWKSFFVKLCHWPEGRTLGE